jgi:protein-S-isoprenylcysteine O-methyltransferase Ste14
MDHGTSTPAYGLWTLVLINSAVFILFAFSFFKPNTKRDWRTFGSFSAFIVALFVEMYGFPLTIYLLAGWLGRRFPGANFFTHDAGHLLYSLLGFKGNPHLNPLHLASNLFILGGFLLLARSWRVLFASQQEKKLATTGPYARMRHPQYGGFIVIMVGFLLQWPTLVTLAMFPILVVTYVRLAHREEREVEAELGDEWRAYAAATPRWIPTRGRAGYRPRWEACGAAGLRLEHWPGKCGSSLGRSECSERRAPYTRAFRRRRALPITETELNAIAAAAMIGLRRRPNTG